MNRIKKITYLAIAGVCFTQAALHALPIDLIHKQGEYLKNLITQANVEQFKKDTAIFFEFDPQFPPSGQQMFEYKKVAKALLDYANLMRAEKFEERKLLLGRTIHNRTALAKAIALGATTGVGIIGSAIALILVRPRTFGLILGVPGLWLTALCAYGARHYYKRAINSIDTINQQTRDLWSIIEHAKQINAQLNKAEEPRA
jgi:hypothetical protein